MATSKLKGITLEIGGDTTGLDAALKGVNKSISETQGELKQVERLLKLDPSNTELLAQKQELLTKSISDTENKLNSLKRAKEQADENGLRGTEEGKKAYRELQREIAATEQKLESFSESNSKLGENLKKAFAGVAGTIAAVGTGMVALEESTREYRSDMSKLETNTNQAGLNFEKMQNNLTGLVALTDETDSSIEALSNLMQTGFNDTGIEKTLESLSGAIIAFPDTLKIESLADGLQETLATGKATGQFGELLERSGMSLDVFNQGLANATSSAEKQDYILEQLAKTGLADVNASYRETNANLIKLKEEEQKTTQIMAQMGESLEPLIANFKEMANELLVNLQPTFEKVIELFNWMISNKEVILTLLASIVAGIAAFNMVTMIQNMVQAFKAWKVATEGMTIAQQLLNLALKANPMGLLVSVIAAVVAALITLWNTNEGFRNAIINAWNAILDVANKVWGAIADFFMVQIPAAFNAVITFIKEHWQSLLMLIVNPIGGAIQLLYELNPKFKEWVDGLLAKFKEWFGKMKDVGKNLVQGLWNGIIDMKNWIIDKVKGFAASILDGIKEAMGIHSPSRETMKDGMYLAQGLGIGFEKEMPSVIDSITKTVGQVTSAISTSLDLNGMPNVSQRVTSQNYYTTKNYQSTFETVKQPVAVDLVLNETKLGRALVPIFENQQKVVGVRI